MENVSTALQVITANTGGKLRNKSLACVNPDAPNADLKTFTTALNGLSTNTLNSIYRVDKKDITTASKPSVTIANGTVKITGDCFTAENAPKFLQKVVCDNVNANLYGNKLSIGYGIVYQEVTEIDITKTLSNNSYKPVYGTLDNGIVITENNFYKNINLSVVPPSLKIVSITVPDSNGCNIVIDGVKATSCINDGTFSSMSSFVTFANNIVTDSSKFSSCDYYLQLSHNAEEASLSFTMSFNNNVESGNFSIAKNYYFGSTLIEVLGAEVFEDYVSGSYLTFTVPNPNYSA